MNHKYVGVILSPNWFDKALVDAVAEGPVQVLEVDADQVLLQLLNNPSFTFSVPRVACKLIHKNEAITERFTD